MPRIAPEFLQEVQSLLVLAAQSFVFELNKTYIRYSYVAPGVLRYPIAFVQKEFNIVEATAGAQQYLILLSDVMLVTAAAVWEDVGSMPGFAPAVVQDWRRKRASNTASLINRRCNTTLCEHRDPRILVQTGYTIHNEKD